LCCLFFALLIFVNTLCTHLLFRSQFHFSTIDGARHGEASRYYLAEDGILKTGNGRTVIPNDAELRRDILDEAHQTRYTVHPISNKMYQDLKNKFWWCGMKMDIAKYVAQCPSCQLLKAEHQRPARELQPLDLPMLKWDQIATDFAVCLPKAPSGQDAIWVILTD
jgi:hypothetical protein